MATSKSRQSSMNAPHARRRRARGYHRAASVRTLCLKGFAMALPPPPADRVYSDSHEWHKLDGSTLTLGITAFAVEQLTDVTYVGMKAKGTKIAAGGSAGEVESVKTTSDIYSAAAGEITEVNKAVVDDPSIINSDPYGRGWLVKIAVSDQSGLQSCMDAKAYAAKYASH
jgi:glycine cleavage system H protein